MTAEVRHLPNPADLAIERAIMDAMRGLARFSPTRVIGAPDAADAENLRSDLLDLCDVVDPLVKAIGDYAAHQFGMSAKDHELFHNQLRGALEGNAAHVLQEIADRLRAQAGSDGNRHDFMRSARAY